MGICIDTEFDNAIYANWNVDNVTDFYYGINEQYGEEWNKYSWIQLSGFVIVLIGSYYYMTVPKVSSKIAQTPIFDTDTDLYGTELDEIHWLRKYSVSISSYESHKR